VRHIRFIMTALAVGCGCPAPSFAQSGQAGPAAAMEQRSAQFAGSYLQVWSSSSRAAVAAVPRLYAPRVLFYGRVLGRRGLMREKARFVQRWPVRHYAHRPGTIQVSCDAHASKCMVRSVVDWRAESPARRAASRGSSRFEQGIDFSAARPVVFREGGSVISQTGRVRRS
jgi:hypothetical protein